MSAMENLNLLLLDLHVLSAVFPKLYRTCLFFVPLLSYRVWQTNYLTNQNQVKLGLVIQTYRTWQKINSWKQPEIVFTSNKYKSNIENLKINYINCVEYHPVREENKWRFNLITETIDIQNSRMSADGMSPEEIQEILHYLCINYLFTITQLMFQHLM